MEKALNIKSYIKDGFKKVCDVEYDNGYDYLRWRYYNIDESVMYSEHRSWIYFIVENDEIVKVGETGNPLGIRQSRSDQPLIGTKCRLGRYVRHPGDTDEYIRDSLYENARDGKSKISIWALECETIFRDINIQGKKSTTLISYHKDLEMVYLNHIVAKTGSIPRLNKLRK